jgi:hypothetical protein
LPEHRDPELRVIPTLPSDVAKATFTPSRLAEIRAGVFAGGVVSPLGIDLLFATLAAHGDSGPDGWSELFVDAVATYVVDQMHPEGFVTPDNAEWLLGRIASDHRVFRRTELAALVEVMRRARSVPDVLSSFTLGILRDAILAGEGALVEPGRQPLQVTAADVEALRTILYAGTSEGFGFVTRPEAEVLFSIARAVGEREYDPSFDDLFARTIGNHVLANATHRVPEMAEALRRERWLDERQGLSDGVGGLFSRILTCVISGDGFVSASGSWLARDAARSVLATAMPEVITPDEAGWLACQMASCGPANKAVAALKAFLREEAPEAALRLGNVA